MVNNKLMEQFLNLAGELSPENLTCDGELSKNAVARKYSKLMTEWHKLEKTAGQKMTEYEVYDWDSKRVRD